VTVRYLVADVFDGLATLPDASVDVVISSPPFLALRSYLPQNHPDKANEIGSEATPAEFIDVLLKVTAELRRVLAPHGSIAIELGDTYSSGHKGDVRIPSDVGKRYNNPAISQYGSATVTRIRGETTPGGEGWPLAKSKTLIPELYRLALAYGFNPLTGQPSPAGQWRVRNVVTWCRPNPPVGALGDKWRPATSDVVVACLSGKRYWDDLATRKPHRESTLERNRYGQTVSQSSVSGPNRGDYLDRVGEPWRAELNASGAPLLDYWEIPEEEEPPRNSRKRSANNRGAPGNHTENDTSVQESNPSGAPLLDYWVIPPGGFKGAHYAVFPAELVVPLVKAMCPQKVCRVCGEPSRRIVKQENASEERLALAAHMKAQREAKGISRADFVPLFPHYKNGESVMAQVSNWELAKNVPSATDWPILVDLLDLSSEFDHLIRGSREWTHDPATYVDESGNAVEPEVWQSGISSGMGAHSFKRTSATRQGQTLGWTDCGHDDFRPGLVLDCFAGSGTTLLVAHGHGHDSIGIDLDERNLELARERVGPFSFEEVTV
jgi:methylase of polypeptide subunit release factors